MASHKPFEHRLLAFKARNRTVETAQVRNPQGLVRTRSELRFRRERERERESRESRESTASSERKLTQRLSEYTKSELEARFSLSKATGGAGEEKKKLD